jgi:hypothetical protein
MAMRDAIYNLLANDTGLRATLTGGLYTSAKISRDNTPEAFGDANEILPCALLKLETQTPWGPFQHSARLYFSVMLYQRAGTEAIEAARKRIYELLHRQKVSPAGGGACWEVQHAGDVLDAEDQALECSLAVSRYVAVVNRS